VLSLSLVVSSSLTNILMVIVVVALVSSDIALHRRGRVRTTWYIASLALTASAIALFVLGRTGAPLCDPESLFQGHALWHVLAALALGAYFVATSDSRMNEEGQPDT
jgi:Ca2+/Na+ antiporter